MKPGVSNVSKEDSSDSDDDAWVDSEDESDDIHDEDDNDNDDGIDDDSGNDGDGGNDAQDSEQTDSDDNNLSFTLTDYKEEEQDEENVLTLEKDRYENEDKMYEEEDDDIVKDLYGDLNIKDSEIPTRLMLNKFDQRVFAFETKVSEFNQTSQFAEAISLIQGIVDNYLASKLKEEVNVEVRLQINKLKEEDELENQEFINQLDSNMKKIIKEQVKAQVSKIMPQIKDHVTETLRAEVLVRSTNQPQTFYSITALLSKLELKNILIDKMETNELINISDIQRNLYNALVESYNTDKDILSTYGDVVTLKRGRDDQDKDEDSFARSDRGTKRRKSSKDAEPSKGSKSKESKSSSSSKGTQSQHKSSSKSTQAEEPEFEAVDIEMHQDQGIESSHIDDQPDNEAVPKHDYTISKECYKERQPPRTFEELMGTPIKFSAFVMNRLKIDNLTHEILEGDFLRLNLCYFEDMLLLLVQKKLFNLDVDDRLEMDYLPKRHWSNLKKKRSHIMIKAIDKLLFERRLMHNLEKFVGGRDYGNDLRTDAYRFQGHQQCFEKLDSKEIA
nr:hypothetical protein [Tanacetum cinerariifolium]